MRVSVLVGSSLALALTAASVPAQSLARDKYFDAAGVRLRYVEQGAGEPIVLVHGFANTAEIWANNGIVQDLARNYRVIAFDVRGHGKSDKPHEAARYGREMALDVVRLLDHLGIQRAHVVGYSLGGYIVSQLLTLHPERVLVGDAHRGLWPIRLGRRPRASWRKSRRANASASASVDRCSFVSRRSTRRGRLRIVSRSLSAKCFADSTQDRFALAALTRSRADQAITPAATAAVKVPTLAIVGTDDPERAGLEALVRIRPSVKLVIVDGATHAGPRGILGRPELIAALRAFLSDHRAK